MDLFTLPHWLPPALARWLPVILAALPALLVAELLFQIGWRVLARAFGHRPLASAVVKAARPVGRLLAPLIALNMVLQGAPDALPALPTLQRIVGMALIACVTWLLVRCVNGLASAVIAQQPVQAADNLAARRIVTQTRVLSRTVAGVIVVVGGALMLMVLPGVRQLGASLLASAGLVGIVAGFAARPVLGNLIAGLQIGLTQPVRIDDVVVVEGEWGTIEEITSAYVVVRVWDQRRLIVPLQYWVEKPFQNWTRSTAEIIGAVTWWVDYRMPLAPLREALRQACESSKDWDGRFHVLQVVETSDRAMQLRALVTAASGSKAWDLRCHVREALIDFMQREYPHCLPRERAEIERFVQGEGPSAEPADVGRPGTVQPGAALEAGASRSGDAVGGTQGHEAPLTPDRR
jgi:small-conductance mechanosensitive channel